MLCASHLGPEVEARIASYRAANGPVLFGGRLASEVDRTLAIPDNLYVFPLVDPGLRMTASRIAR